MKKKCLIKSIVFLSVFLIGSLIISNNANASTITENFDSYSTGWLNNNNGWYSIYQNTCSTSTNNTIQIASTYSDSSPNAINLSGQANERACINFSSTTEMIIEWDAFLSESLASNGESGTISSNKCLYSGASKNHVQYTLWINSGGGNLILYGDSGTSISIVYGGVRIPFNTWYHYKWELNYNNGTTTLTYYNTLGEPVYILNNNLSTYDSQFTDFCFQGMTGKDGVWIDNLEITIPTDYGIITEKEECENEGGYWNYNEETCYESLPDCATYTTQYECSDYEFYPIPYAPTNRCEWNFETETCSTLIWPLECESASSTASNNPYYCRYCETESECESVNEYCEWDNDWPWGWDQKCVNTNADVNWVGSYDPLYTTTTISTTTDEMTATDILSVFTQIMSNPKEWFENILETVNPFDNAPFSWIYQFVNLINTEYQKISTGTMTGNPEFASSTWSTVEFDIFSTGTTTAIRLFNFDWAYEGEWKNLFEKLKFLLQIVLWFGTIFALWRMIVGWLNKQSTNS